jgi:DNA polymerase III epsilon subunit-like protein
MGKFNKIIIIDFEASGLHSDSYPTEIAWIDPVLDEKATSYLIKPSQKWLDSRWDYKAEKITGISQKMIISNGSPLNEVAEKIQEVLSQADVILTDAPDLDRNWLMVLLEAARMDVPVPSFTELHSFIRTEFDKDIYFEGEATHRAGKDVELMAAAFNLAAYRS